MGLYKLDHLRDCLRGKDGQQVGYQQELVRLVRVRSLRLEPTQRNALAVVGTAPAPVDQWRVEAVDIEVLVVHEEAFPYSGVAVCQRVAVEPRSQGAVLT